jgi:hypothetical protein
MRGQGRPCPRVRFALDHGRTATEVDEPALPDELGVGGRKLAEKDRVGGRPEQRGLPRHRPAGVDHEIDGREEHASVDWTLRITTLALR